MSKYVIGVDFGTLSARALLIDTADGREIATSEYSYPHGIMTEKEINGGEPLPTTALQHPKDYLDALSYTIKQVISIANISSSEVIGVGIDFTSCTVLPIYKDGTPLCFDQKFKSEKHAYVKLWKHHGANEQAELMTKVAKETNQDWIDDYGGKISSEWLLPKLLETAQNAKEVYDHTDYYLEAGDWLTYLLTGNLYRSSCMAGFKALWGENRGYPDQKYLNKVDNLFENVLPKLSGKVLPTGVKAGELNQFGAELLGLKQGVAVAVPVIDAHVALPSAGVTEDGGLLIIMGTSACHIILSEKDVKVKGICGKVKDGVVPNYYAYESGQAGFGDILEWFINNWVPKAYFEQAEKENKNIFGYLNDLAKKIPSEKQPILVLDWWNGNRTPYADYSLSGVVAGLNLKTTPEEIYKGIITSLALGSKRIVELYQNNGISVNEITASGGIAVKNPYFMQVFADVLDREVKVVDSRYAGAKGSAIYASVASDCFDNISNASEVIADKCNNKFVPNRENAKVYEKIYADYLKLSEFFAK